MNKCVWCVSGFGILVRSVVARRNVGYLYTRVCVVSLKASVCVCVLLLEKVCVCVLNKGGKFRGSGCRSRGTEPL